MSEYALYEGDTFITMGTLAERMLKYYTFASTQRRHPNGRAVVKIEVDDE